MQRPRVRLDRVDARTHSAVTNAISNNGEWAIVNDTSDGAWEVWCNGRVIWIERSQDAARARMNEALQDEQLLRDYAAQNE